MGASDVHSAAGRRRAGWLLAAVLALPFLTVPALAQDVAPEAGDPDAGGLAGSDIAGPALQKGKPPALKENYGDWAVGCTSARPIKNCFLSQMQVNKENRQRVFAVELSVPKPNTADGLVILPFGLDVARGVTLVLDDGKPGDKIDFRTCVPVGCLVPLSFDTAYISKLMQAKTLKIAAYAVEGAKADSSRPVSFTISLTGFGRALARTTELSR